MKKFKKLFSFALALVVAASVLPTNVAKAADTAPIGIDVSWENGEIDWAQAAAEVDFAVIRATEGTMVDDEFTNNADGCTANAVPFGVSVYTLAQDADDAIAEAELVIEMLDGYTLDLPIYMEFEDADMYALTDAEKLAVVEAFVETVTEAGYEAGLYATMDTYNAYFASNSYYSTLNIWVSDLDATSLPLASANMWQYAWDGTVAGVDNGASLNYYYGDLPESEHVCTPVTDAAVAPTCTETGLTEGSHCDECGEVIVAQEVVPALGHTEEAVAGKAPTCTETGLTEGSKCSVCGDELSRDTIPMLRVSGATLALETDISIVYKVKTSCVNGYYDDVYVVVAQYLEGDEVRETIVRPVLNGTNYEFSYAGVSAKEIGDYMDVKVYGTFKGELVEGETLNYGVMNYVTSQLSKIDSSSAMSAAKKAAFKTLMVDLVCFGAAAQIGATYKVDTLPTALLTDAQLALASDDSVIADIKQVTNTKYEEIENPTVIWKSAGLETKSKIIVRVQVQYAGNIDDVQLYVKVAGGEAVPVTTYELVEGTTDRYYFSFDKLIARQFSDTLDFYFVQGDTVVSNTLRYSIESYAAKYQTNASIGPVVKSMMKYGYAAKAYGDAE